MRWESQAIDSNASPSASGQTLFALPAVVRTFDSPQFAGMTFFEVHAKSILNKVPGASRMPFDWTINPYRGCSHACRYCFARNTHTYLDLGAGLGEHLEFEDGRAGGYVALELRAEMDVLMVISNCPQLNNPCNGYNPTPVQVLIWD